MNEQRRLDRKDTGSLLLKSLSKSASWDAQSSSASRLSSPSRSTRPPFALDEFFDEDAVSRASASSQGYRAGGPKEARLRRVALLSKAKEVDHLHPVKVYNIPPSASPDKLQEVFSEFGEVGDVYIPMDCKERAPKSDFAIVRYKSRDALDKLLSSSSPPLTPNSSSSSSFSPVSWANSNPNSPLKRSASRTMSRPTTSDGRPLSVNDRPVAVGPLLKQQSFFSNGTGYHGLCNEVVEDGTYNRDPVLVKQDVSLSSCLSRSGYPWGSVRELKYLSPHLPTAAYEQFTLKLENLHEEVTPEEIKEEFERRYQVHVFVDCPKPVVVTDLIDTPNNGYACVRFEDKRDRDSALKDVMQGKIQLRGATVTGKDLKPSYWPRENTRRYY